MIIAPMASPRRRINPFVRNLLQEQEECDFLAADRIQPNRSFCTNRHATSTCGRNNICY